MQKAIHSDCLEALKAMPDNSIDSIVTDSPAGIGFMGKDWDKDKGGRDNWIAWMQEIAQEAFRVVKPGAHALVWALPRTSHWTATAWENAGFEVRDSISHVFGSGFPKSMDIGKAIDKAAGAEREIVGANPTYRKMQENATNYNLKRNPNITAPATESAKQWDGWGTALKPAREDWILLRKPFKGTVAENVLQWGTGGINIDGCRVETKEGDEVSNHGRKAVKNGWDPRMSGSQTAGQTEGQKLGRWPANFIHDGSDEVLGLFPDGGSAARFFYCAKPSTAERNEGLDDLPQMTPGECTDRKEGSAGLNSPRSGAGRTSGNKNHHPTVKSINLMRYLCRLITPPGGTVLDMFMGSGTTIIAAHMEGFNAIGIEREEEYFKIAENRIKHWTAQNTLL